MLLCFEPIVLKRVKKFSSALNEGCVFCTLSSNIIFSHSFESLYKKCKLYTLFESEDLVSSNIVFKLTCDDVSLTMFPQQCTNHWFSCFLDDGKMEVL